MSPNTKNIIIVAVVAIALGLAYFFFIKPAPEQASLVSTTDTTPAGVTGNTGTGSTVPESQFLSVLLNVTNIQLNDSVFSDPAFTSLHDSSIELISNVPEGRPNPFAPIGSDVVATPPTTVAPTTTTTTTTSTTTTTPTNTTTPPTTQSPKP